MEKGKVVPEIVVDMMRTLFHLKVRKRWVPLWSYRVTPSRETGTKFSHRCIVGDVRGSV